MKSVTIAGPPLPAPSQDEQDAMSMSAIRAMRAAGVTPDHSEIVMNRTGIPHIHAAIRRNNSNSRHQEEHEKTDCDAGDVTS